MPPDFSGQNLQGQSFKGQDLTGANFSGADLSGADLSGAKLNGASFEEIQISSKTVIEEKRLLVWRLFWRIVNQEAVSQNLRKANLREADLRGADLSEANLRGANLSGANLRGANLSGANLSGANLMGANFKAAQISPETIIDDKWRLVWRIVNQEQVSQNLSRADLSRANLSGFDLSGANLSKANLSKANLSEANLSGANLSEANLSEANLSEANLSGANLKAANFREAQISPGTVIDDKWRLVWKIVNQGAVSQNLSGANLSGANLSGANLSGANLSGANLSEANLGGANLSGANLSEANLSEADLRAANFREAQISPGTVIDDKWRLVWRIVNQGAVSQNLSGTNLSEANLGGANLSEANLMGANLGGANLMGANFSGANLMRANFKAAQISPETIIDDKWRLVWRIVNQEQVSRNLSRADLSRANLSGANLIEANLSGADLNGANLMEANLTEANLSRANLTEANLTEANLTEANLTEANLTEANLTEANLIGANLSMIDLSRANLSEVDLSWVNLSGVDLSGVDLSRTQALGTNFAGAKFTGVCLEDWNINSATNLDYIDCQYIYLKRDKQERRPSSGEFKSGEFTKLFQKVLNTLDLIFSNGVDWGAFVAAFDEVKVKNEETELIIQAIENKGDGVVVIKVQVPADANKENIYSDFTYKYQEYQQNLKVLETKLQTKTMELQAKDIEVTLSQQKSSDFFSIITMLATRNISNVAIAGSKSMSEAYKYNLSEAKFGGGFSGDGGTTIGGNFYDHSSKIDYSSKQNLAEAAVEIQQILAQLQSQGDSEEQAQQKVASDLARQAQNNPALRDKLTKWGEYVKDAATSGVIGEAAVVVLKLALASAGISLP